MVQHIMEADTSTTDPRYRVDSIEEGRGEVRSRGEDGEGKVMRVLRMG
jgi:hypothetical protein